MVRTLDTIHDVAERGILMLGTIMQAEAEMAVRDVMRSVMASDVCLLAIVSGGEHHWMLNAGKAFAGMAVPDQVLHDMFRYFKAQAGPNPSKTLDAVLKAKAAERTQGGPLDDIREN
jgi:hypothetical protein